MRLLLLSSEFPPGPGGIGTHAFQIANHLQQLNWKVRVAAVQEYMSDKDIAHFNRQQPFAISRFATGAGFVLDGLRRWLTARTCLAEHHPDVVLATGARSVWIAGSLLQLDPDIVWAAVGHGTEFSLDRAWERIITRWAFNQANLVISVSEHTETRMRLSGVSPQRSVVIHNGADHTRFSPASQERRRQIRKALGIDHHTRILLTVGNVTRRKGQDIVIQALPDVIAQFPDTIYLVAGIPTLAEKYSEIARGLGVADHVHFLGRVSNDMVRDLVRICDVFLMTSRSTEDGDLEGYGIAVIEAALCEKPAIVSDNSGLVEAVQPGVTGLVVPQKDPAATSNAILSMFVDDPLRREMGSAARQRALTEQTWELCAARYDNLLRELVAR